MHLSDSAAPRHEEQASGIAGFDSGIKTDADVMQYTDEQQQCVLQTTASSSQWIAADCDALVEVDS
ncbi:MAG: hypothetical protein J07HX5_00225 [halophilic archaeon J07HX5]|nr:MAG: hypothetical protein J07HX5_00225 [halophilic archaeon J07HX5]